MNPAAFKRLRLLASAVSLLVVVAALALGWIYWRVRASLPQLEGTATVAGLAGPVAVTRDALGVPTIRAASRIDAARALGWLHGQDRFFQMDLLRRSAAGEIAELFGPRALPRDRRIRMHGFRALARQVIDRLDPDQRALVEAYCAGVNTGVAALRERTFEYLLLRQAPVPWRPEDSILVAYAMTIDLQFEDGGYERTLMTLRDEYGADALAFFAPVVTPADAALDGSTAPLAAIPGPRVINLRAKTTGATPTPAVGGSAPPRLVTRAAPRSDRDSFPFFPRDPDFLRGSSAFALAGSATATGAGILANDMHLDHGVPNIWYRASIEYEGRKVTGVTLPGTPAVVAGSNGHVAWGFTNSCIDTGDVVVVERNSIAHTLYRVPGRDELVPMERRSETIRVKGEDPVTVDYEWTVWGPIVGADERGLPLALRMVAHDPAATNLALLDLEGATSTAAAIAIAHRAGMPAQNIMIADRAGTIAWTIAGRVPKRVGFDGRLPVTWGFGDRKWDGYLAPAEIPVVFGPDTVRPGRLWSGNQRHVGGDALAKLGDGAYRRPARAAQIRDGLAPLTQAKPADLLAILLDDRALFLKPWHELLVQTLSPAATARKPARGALRAAAETWEGRATVEAVSFRLVKMFRAAVYDRVFNPIFAPCVERYPAFDYRDLLLETPLWSLLREKPLHLLGPEYASWEDLLFAAADDVNAELAREGVKPARATWGARNTAQIRHPFTHAFPWLGRWLNMPRDPLPGDADMPRVQNPRNGASERLVVSPGHEPDGIFHMPGGQSAHPLSPYFRAGHSAWVRGDPTPFLPGPKVHAVELRP
jgi:penicillin amidase